MRSRMGRVAPGSGVSGSPCLDSLPSPECLLFQTRFPGNQSLRPRQMHLCSVVSVTPGREGGGEAEEGDTQGWRLCCPAFSRRSQWCCLGGGFPERPLEERRICGPGLPSRWSTCAPQGVRTLPSSRQLSASPAWESPRSGHQWKKCPQCEQGSVGLARE